MRADPDATLDAALEEARGALSYAWDVLDDVIAVRAAPITASRADHILSVLADVSTVRDTVRSALDRAFDTVISVRLDADQAPGRSE